MKKFLSLFLMLILGLVVHSKEYYGITIMMLDGSITTVRLSGEPVIKYCEEKIVITTNETTAEIAQENVVSLSYSDVNSVEDLADSTDNLYISKKGEMLIFENLPTNSNILMHNINGIQIKNITASDYYEISLSNLSAGIYIVSVNGVSTKISINR
ncbi:MAG: T9SS type A sorting domain-containing protein [Muribaculaceae bacterium]|nr:T9SS type A sorting domain-containing protein [Muribaculaceae bacterium]